MLGLLGSARREREEIDKVLSSTESLDYQVTDPTLIHVGDTVVVQAIDEHFDDTYTIVPAGVDARLGDWWISASSPLASALLGHTRGETVEVSAPSGMVRYLIVNHFRDH